MSKTIKDIAALKQAGEKIAMLTAYDSSFSYAADQAGVDVLLVGDSLGMVVQGQNTTLPVSVNDMVYHARAVRRGAPDAYIVVDMPYLSVSTPERALKNAGKIIQRAYANMVKIEGGDSVLSSIKALVENNVPVCGHLGLQPQSVELAGGYQVQGREHSQAEKIMREAQALEAAGVQMLVLECVPADLARAISLQLSIPVIGIGAGVDCDGQVLVCYDMLGLTAGKRPRFSHDFLQESASNQEAIALYVSRVKQAEFPSEQHSFK